MKKVLFTLLTCVFMLIPISIKADLTCTYDPTSAVGDKFGEITITKKDNGSFLVNGESLTSSSTVDLKRQVSGTNLYFPGGSVDIMFGKTIDSKTVKKNNKMEDHCNTYKHNSCGTNIKNVNGPSQFVFDCHKGIAIIHCNVDDSSIKAGGNYNVLNKVFTGNTCPALNFGAEYSKDAKNMYLLLLTENDIGTGKATTAAKSEGTIVNEKDLVNINYVYFSDNNNKENYNFFDSIVYNKATGKLKFNYNAAYSDQSFELDPSIDGDGNSTTNIKKVIKFNDREFTTLQFKIYKGFKAKLDNWKSSDFIVIAFSTEQLDAIGQYLNFHVVYSDDIKSFAKDVYYYDDDQAKNLFNKIRSKAADVLNIGGEGELKKFDVETIPFCAPTSGALKVFKIVGYAIVVIKILVPIALIIFASIDFFRAMMSSNEDAIKKATTTVMQRAVIGILIFFIPTLVYYAVGLLGNSVKRDDSYFENCNTCLLNPDECPARDPYVAEDTKK